jgi:hypothetical protein
MRGKGIIATSSLAVFICCCGSVAMSRSVCDPALRSARFTSQPRGSFSSPGETASQRAERYARYGTPMISLCPGERISSIPVPRDNDPLWIHRVDAQGVGIADGTYYPRTRKVAWQPSTIRGNRRSRALYENPFVETEKADPVSMPEQKVSVTSSISAQWAIFCQNFSRNFLWNVVEFAAALTGLAVGFQALFQPIKRLLGRLT